jgi:hypothetical protein
MTRERFKPSQDGLEMDKMSEGKMLQILTKCTSLLYKTQIGPAY